MNNQLTINELRAYQAGQLDGPARHRIERLLLEDPFYADALEGLEALQRTGASLPKQTAQLRRALHERINESATERRLFPLWITTMAASIALVMGVALYFIYTTKPVTTAVKKPTISTHSEPIVIEIGPKDSSLAKTVETVAVLESHVARLRGGKGVVERPRSAERRTMYSLPAKRGPVSSQAGDEEYIEIVLTHNNYEQEVKPEIAIDDAPRPNYRRITNPERAFGPNAPEAPEVTFWSDASARFTLARSFVASRLIPTQAAMLTNAYSAPQSVAFETPKGSTANGILLAPVTVVGYGTQSKRELTGAVSAVKPALAPRFMPTQTMALNIIEGTITDQKGEPLPGVQVTVKGTNRGTTTNAAGQFSLDSLLVGGQTLTIASVGFKTQELNALVLKKGSIQLTEDTQVLNEVVVTGYGRAKPKRSEAMSVKTTNRTKTEEVVGVLAYVTELNKTESQAFLDYVKKEAAPYLEGPLEIRIHTKADGSVRQVSVEKGIRIHETGQKRVTRSFIPSQQVVAEAERLVRQYPNWPKKRQWFLWVIGWNKP